MVGQEAMGKQLDGKDGWMGREGKWLDEKKMKLIKREDRSTENKEDWYH